MADAQGPGEPLPQTENSVAAAASQAAPPVGDGWPDISSFLDRKYGFLPIASLITEPAVGLGGAGGLAFIDRPLGSKPNIAFVGGMGTENGTKGAFAGDLRHWMDGRLETRVALVYASINLDFFGVGSDPELEDSPLRYNLEPAVGFLDVRYRAVGPMWVGLGYAYAKTLIRFDAAASTPGLPAYSSASTIGAISPSLTFDTRDNIFTPTRGTYVEGVAGIFREGLGADANYQRAQVTALHFVRLPAQLFAGARVQASTSSADTPFYLRPFVYQRGVQAMRYLGEQMAQAEGELRWQFWNRLSVVGFAGVGKTWTSLARIDRTKTVTAGGGGLRYELARRYGIHIGVDAAWGPDGSAYYMQWGSAWIRP